MISVYRSSFFFLQGMLLGMFCLAGTGSLWAQSVPFLEPTVQAYNQMDGIPQLQVKGMFQDSRGMLWVGTKNGAAYFDGEQFYAVQDMTDSLGMHVNCFAEDEYGVIWMGCTFGVARYDGKRVICYRLPEGHRGVNSLEFDESGRLWLLAERNLFTLEKGEFINQTSWPGLPPDSVLVVEKDSASGRIFLGVLGQGFFELLPGEKQLKRIKAFPEASSIGIREGEGERLIFQAGDRGVYSEYYEWTSADTLRKFLRMNSDGSVAYFRAPLGDVCIKKDFENALYFRGGLSKYEEINLLGYPLVRPFLDRSGTLWLGTESGMVQYFGNLFQQGPPSIDNSWFTIQGDDGTYWFGSYYWGLKRYGPDGVERLTLPAKNPVRRKQHCYFGPSKDEDGTLYFPHGAGIFRLENGQMDLILEGTTLFSFYDTVSHQLMTGARGGVKILNKQGAYRFIGQEEGLHEASFIVSIEKEQDSVYWLGSYYGLTRFDQATNTLRNYPPATDTFPSKGVISMHRDKMGTVWMGSRSGLLKYEPTSDRLVRVSPLLGTEPVNFIGSIDSSYLIYSQPDGIYIMDLAEYYRTGTIRQRFFNASNGFLGHEPNQNGLSIDNQGYVWMVTGDKVIRMDPAFIDLTAPSLQPYIKKYNSKPGSFHRDSMWIVLDRNQRNVTVQLGAIGFERPNQVQYAYRVPERDTQWSAWSTNDHIFLSDLRSGRYTFEVQAKIPGIKASAASIASFPMVVDLAFWREPHFARNVFIFAVLLALVLSLFFLYQIRRERRKRESNDRKMRLLQVQTLQAQMNPHFVFNVLGSLQNLILNNDKETANTYLVRLSRLIRSYLNSSIKSDYSKGFSADNEITLKEEIELLTMYIEFEKLQFQDRFDYEIQVDNDLVPENRTIPPMLLQPYVENAIKHGLLYKKGKGFLSVRFTENPHNDGMIITIEDDGVGMEAAKEIQLRSVRGFKSKGRKLVKERLEVLKELGYEIEADTQTGDWGTRVVIIIG